MEAAMFGKCCGCGRVSPRREIETMIAIAVVIVLGIAYGVCGGNGGNGGEFGAISVEARQSVREGCYKLSALREKDKGQRFPASVMLIYGVMRQEMPKSGGSAKQYEANTAREYKVPHKETWK